MRIGLRLQLLGMLAALMLLAFLPLFFATRAYTRVAFANQRQKGVGELVQSVALHLAEARPRLDEGELLSLMSAQAEGGAVQAVFAFSRDGRVLMRAGRPELMNAMPAHLSAHRGPKLVSLRYAGHDLLAAIAPSPRGDVVTLGLLGGEDASAPLTALMGLYMGVIALLALVVAYFALTRSIVRPILDLERDAERVAQGGRHLRPLAKGPAELVGLSHSLSTMTRKLLEEEDSLRRKIEEVESQAKLLEAAQASLVRSERLATVGRLSAGLAHEIGNPISALMGFEDLLLEGGLSEAEQRDFLTRMKRETARIHRVLGDLLAYARAPRPSLGGDTEPGSVGRAVDEVLALLAPQKDLAEVSLVAEVEPGLSRVPLSQEELTQVLLNLVMNAVDACQRKGHVTVAAARGDESRIVLSVSDDGPGIDPAVRDTLFEPFVSTKEVGKGTGLGLAVTRGLVESGNGSLRLDTSYSPGARFVVELPAVAAISSSSVTA
jgi:signal transduction histidine kinase